MFNQKEISDEEINGYKDFNNLIKAKGKVVRQNAVRQSLLLGILLIAGFSFIYFSSKENIPKETQKVKEKSVMGHKQQSGNSAPEPLGNVLNEKKEVLPDQNNKQISTKEEYNKIEKPIDIPKLRKSKDEDHIPEILSEEFVEAHPVDGFTVLFEYLENELNYPEKAIKDEVEGTVLVEFSIMKTGRIADLKIVKGVSPEIDQEALRLISEMPAWVPASIGPEKYKSKLTIPLTFHIEKSKNTTN